MKFKCAMLGMVMTTAALFSAQCWAEPAQPADAQAISALIETTWEKPGMEIHVEPVSVSGEYAVAGWVEGQRGGRALLKRSGDAWSVILCSGDGIKTASGLAAAGVPTATAEVLAASIGRQEATLPAETIKKFSLFEGSGPVSNGEHAGHHGHQ